MYKAGFPMSLGMHQDIYWTSSRVDDGTWPNPVWKTGKTPKPLAKRKITEVVVNNLTNLKTYLNPDLTKFLSLIINLDRLTTDLLRLRSNPTPQRIFWYIPSCLISGRKTMKSGSERCRLYRTVIININVLDHYSTLIKSTQRKIMLMWGKMSKQSILFSPCLVNKTWLSLWSPGSSK